MCITLWTFLDINLTVVLTESFSSDSLQYLSNSIFKQLADHHGVLKNVPLIICHLYSCLSFVWYSLKLDSFLCFISQQNVYYYIFFYFFGGGVFFITKVILLAMNAGHVTISDIPLQLINTVLSYQHSVWRDDNCWIQVLFTVTSVFLTKLIIKWATVTTIWVTGMHRKRIETQL